MPFLIIVLKLRSSSAQGWYSINFSDWSIPAMKKGVFPIWFFQHNAWSPLKTWVWTQFCNCPAPLIGPITPPQIPNLLEIFLAWSSPFVLAAKSKSPAGGRSFILGPSSSTWLGVSMAWDNSNPVQNLVKFEPKRETGVVSAITSAILGWRFVKAEIAVSKPTPCSKSCATRSTDSPSAAEMVPDSTTRTRPSSPAASRDCSEVPLKRDDRWQAIICL